MNNNLQLYWRLLRYLSNVREWVVIAIITIIATAATEPLIPALMKPLVDSSLIAKDPASIKSIPLLILALFVFRGVVDYFNRISIATISEHSIETLRRQLFNHMQHSPLSFYDKNTSGELISKFTFDVAQISQAMSQVWIVLIRDSLIVIALISYLIFVSWQLSLTLLIAAPVAGYLIHKASQTIRKVSTQSQNSMGRLTHVLEENIGAHCDVKLFGGEEQEKQRFAHIARQVRNQFIKINRISAINVPLVQVIAAVCVCTVLYIAFEMDQKQLTPGDFVSYITAMTLLFEPVRRLTRVNESLQRGLAAANSLFSFLDAPSEENHGTQVADNITGEIVFDQVTFAYPNAEMNALSDFSLHIPAGKTIALVGASGSGKTTVLNMLARFYAPHCGNILVDNVPIQQYELNSYRTQLAQVSQQVILFNDSVRANIAYGCNQQCDQDAIEQAAKNAHAHTFIQKLPEGYETNIGDNGARLSGGQRQRIALARAFLKKAPVLLLDEASSALDTKSERLVQKAMKELCADRTTIIIAHRLSTVQNADHIIVMDNGKIREQGTHEQLLALNQHYALLYNQGLDLYE